MRRSLTISLFPESRKRFLTAASLKFLSTQIAKSYLKINYIALVDESRTRLFLPASINMLDRFARYEKPCTVLTVFVVTAKL